MRARLRKAVAEEILTAAEAVMAERGVHAAALSEIAGRAGVSVGTVYNHFADRKALVAALYRTRRDRLAPRLIAAARAGAGTPFEARLGAFVREVLVAFDEHRSFVRVAMESDHARPDRGEGSGGRPLLARILEPLAELVAAGADEGVVPDGDHDLFARFVLAGIKAVVQRNVQTDRPFADDAEAVTRLVLRGLLRTPSVSER